MRLRFPDPREGETSRVPRRWRRQSERSAASAGSSGSESGSLGPYPGLPKPVIIPEPTTETPSAERFTIAVAAIKFSGADTDYNPLYDREPSFPHLVGLKIDPPQWQTAPPKNEPISYVRGKKATVKLDITGLPNISDDDASLEKDSIWVKVTPTAELRKQILVKRNDELVAVEDPDASPYPLTFDPPSQTIEVSNWSEVDYDALVFMTSALPDEVRLDELRITWDFKYGQTPEGPWTQAGEETTQHEMYLTYARSYEGFEPYYYPWKQVLRRACFYAHGATTPTQISSLVTTGIYDSLEFDYDGENTHAWSGVEIELWEMLRDGWMDCRDGSNYYTILMRWLGITAWNIEISENTGGFYYNTLRPISTASDPNYITGWSVRVTEGELDVTQFSNWWAFHQVGIFNDEPNLLGIDEPPDIDDTRTKICDPIIMIDRENPTVPVNMTKEAYSLALFDPVAHPTHGMNQGQNDWAKKGELVGRVL